MQIIELEIQNSFNPKYLVKDLVEVFAITQQTWISNWAKVTAMPDVTSINHATEAFSPITICGFVLILSHLK